VLLLPLSSHVIFINSYYNTKVEYVQEVPHPVLTDNLAEVAYIEIFLKTNNMHALAAKYIELCWGLWPQIQEISQYT